MNYCLGHKYGAEIYLSDCESGSVSCMGNDQILINDGFGIIRD